jgi:hypothetical protein
MQNYVNYVSKYGHCPFNAFGTETIGVTGNIMNINHT